MRNSDPVTRVSTLADLPIDLLARVIEVDADGSAVLACHGLRAGVVVCVESDAPFGGPRVVRLGRARVAVARSVARLVAVRVEPPARASRR